jgi:hypothetical protein
MDMLVLELGCEVLLVLVLAVVVLILSGTEA